MPTIDEQLERLKQVTLEQVRSLYHDYLGADHGELVIVGDFEPSEVLPILAKTFDGWKAASPTRGSNDPYQPDLEPERETDPDARQGKCRLPRRPLLADQGRRSRLPGPLGRATSSWGAADSRPASPIACARKDGLSYTRDVDVRGQPARSSTPT